MRESNAKWMWNNTLAILALLGGLWIVSGAMRKQHIELDHGGYIALVRKSWWGLREEYFKIRLQHYYEWEQGLPYREPNCGLDDFYEFDWFIEGEGGAWYPMDFVGPPDLW